MDPVVLIFAGLALFIIFKLISVLGTRNGHEAPQEIAPTSVSDADRATNSADEGADAAAAPPAPVSPAAADLRAADPQFDEREFLDGAKAAYEMIVEAFAAGDMRSIRRYLDEQVYEAFKRAVTDRETANQRFELKFVGIEKASVASSSVADGAMNADVDFVSNQVRATYDSEGALIDGDPNRVDLVRDRWTFSRPATSTDPNWTLVATGGA
ncbi:MAG: Tim44/TimA family putative adaptor protein [Parvularculaceae bacterium]